MIRPHSHMPLEKAMGRTGFAFGFGVQSGDECVGDVWGAARLASD